MMRKTDKMSRENDRMKKEEELLFSRIIIALKDGEVAQFEKNRPIATPPGRLCYLEAYKPNWTVN